METFYEFLIHTLKEEGTLSVRHQDHLLEGLNPEQRNAVESPNGPMLILAGAGSGKTRVLTQRIAFLVERCAVPPSGILAVTFTNKAAGEMRERVRRHIHRDLSEAWIGTFHSICARILRQQAELLGFARQFTIYDDADQLSLVKQLAVDLQIPTDKITPGSIQRRIGHAKNALLSPDEFSQNSGGNFFDETVAKVYFAYQRALKENNAMDFDDLLLYPIRLFESHPDILQRYQNRFQNILVDEYQDTNRAQYIFLKQLAAGHQNLCVVGDDDQSIYSWRGADIKNILAFEKDFPNCRTFRLEQNYRSTKGILAAAHSVVVKNSGRMAKQLWTEREDGEKVALLELENDLYEAQSIVDKINEEFGHSRRLPSAKRRGETNGSAGRAGRSFRDFAVLYRINAQSRLLEEALLRASIPYVIVGGLRFYERKEIKDVLAYMRLAANPPDSISLRRAINYPLRGIGEATMRRLETYAREHALTLFEALKDGAAELSERAKDRVLEFYHFINKYIHLKSSISLLEWANALIDETGIIPLLKSESSPESINRIENIRELQRAIADYAAGSPGATIEEFLEQVALVSDIDGWKDKSNAVSLMTLHSAKGLEFPVVFLVGLEDGLFPLSRSLEEPANLEEERRLFYVGATRARDKLYLSWAAQRMRMGQRMFSEPSRFLREMDDQWIERDGWRPSRRGGIGYAVETPQSPVARAGRMPKYEDESQDIPTIQSGQRVRHELFGIGKIVSAEGHGENLKVTVRFAEAGTKKLVLKYANLQFL